MDQLFALADVRLAGKWVQKYYIQSTHNSQIYKYADGGIVYFILNIQGSLPG